MSDSALPDADIDGFVDWLENEYTDERWSHIIRRNGSVTVWSGMYPEFLTFQDDLRPKLHDHGLVITKVNKDIPRKIDGEMESVHWIKAMPIAKAAAKAMDMQCKRRACTEIIADDESVYCADCKPSMTQI